MAKGKPTMAQAQLRLQLYDLRREAGLRQAREWFLKNYAVTKAEDIREMLFRIPNSAFTWAARRSSVTAG